MAKAKTTSSNRAPATTSTSTGNSSDHHNAAAPGNEEQHGLLAARDGTDDEEDDEDELIVHPGDGSPGAEPLRTPRTPNRVRFDLRTTSIPPAAAANGHQLDSSGYPRRSSDSDDLEMFDPLSPDGGRGHSTALRPLLTDIEAPSVALANSPWGDEDVHSWAEAERARPKSGLQSAFMNMANSIIGAGIIGQPYAFRQAGLLAGVVLLVGLTVVVDWTIRLIVVNSKLSGANSFQGTVEHCFGKPGLVAISVAQWAFAFGGMVAFGVIVGDSIPHVLQAVWPGLSGIPVLGLLADRRVVIVVFTMSISYPLTLYRDIAKVSSVHNPRVCYGWSYRG